MTLESLYKQFPSQYLPCYSVAGYSKAKNNFLNRQARYNWEMSFLWIDEKCWSSFETSVKVNYVKMQNELSCQIMSLTRQFWCSLAHDVKMQKLTIIFKRYIWSPFKRWSNAKFAVITIQVRIPLKSKNLLCKVDRKERKKQKEGVNGASKCYWNFPANFRHDQRLRPGRQQGARLRGVPLHDGEEGDNKNHLVRRNSLRNSLTLRLVSTLTW